MDLLGLLGTTEDSQSIQGDTAADLDHCQTGADANEHVDCRMVGAYNSLDDFWSQHYPEVFDQSYRSPGMEVFTGSVQTGCGGATSAMGPFYCPADESIYIDTSFYQTMESQLGAEGGPMAEMYVIAHEWGHHLQHTSGIMERADRGGAGATSDSVRLELQADCLAGAWVAGASTTEDSRGHTLLAAATPDQWRQTLDAAASVGDDHIQAQGGQPQHSESWTHGSSDQRMRWLERGTTWYTQDMRGFECDTFVVSGAEL